MVDEMLDDVMLPREDMVLLDGMFEDELLPDEDAVVLCALPEEELFAVDEAEMLGATVEDDRPEIEAVIEAVVEVVLLVVEFPHPSGPARVTSEQSHQLQSVTVHSTHPLSQVQPSKSPQPSSDVCRTARSSGLSMANLALPRRQ